MTEDSIPYFVKLKNESETASFEELLLSLLYTQYPDVLEELLKI